MWHSVIVALVFVALLSSSKLDVLKGLPGVAAVEVACGVVMLAAWWLDRDAADEGFMRFVGWLQGQLAGL